MGKYDEGTEVVFYVKHGNDNQKFSVNQDGTISPLKAPEMVIGMEKTCLQHDAEAT